MSKIVLLGSYGRGNVGDDVFLVALTKLLGRHTVTANSAHNDLLPTEVINKISTISTISNKDIIDKLKVFLKADYIIYGGGDLWVELYGSRFPRIALWKMAVVNTVAKVSRKKVIYVGCGCGNIRGFSLLLAKYSALLANLIIFRDEISRQKIRKDAKTQVLPDLSITLSSKDIKLVNNVVKTLGIIPMYYIPDPVANYPKYLAQMISSCQYALKQNISVKLIPMLKDPAIYDDVKVCDDIFKSVKALDIGADISILKEVDSSNINDILQTIDVCLSTRLHGSILAAWLHVPVIGVSYRPKVSRFLKSVGLEISSIDIHDTDSLNDKMDLCFKNPNMFTIDPTYLKTLRTEARKEYIKTFKTHVI